MNSEGNSRLSHFSLRFQLTGGFAALACLALSTLSYADDAKVFQWHSTNVQFLQGQGYALGRDSRSIISINHANGWTYGDNILFYDKTFKGQDYFEWHPRLSLSKISGKSFKFGAVKDVLLAGTVEVPEAGSRRYLAGVGFDWDLPSFNFFKTNFYIRDNPDLAGVTWGSTIAWKKKFKLGSQPFLFDGFIDFAGAEGSRAAYQLYVPALLADIGQHFGHDDRLYLGVEYQYWYNKFGLRGVTESVPQAELRWVIQ